MTAQIAAGLFLYDDTKSKIVGLKNPDGSEQFLFSSLYSGLNSATSLHGTLAWPPTSDGILAAVDRISASGRPGVVEYVDVPYIIDKPIPLVAGVSHDGILGKLVFGGDIPDQDFNMVGGTQLIILPGVNGFTYNNVASGAIASPLAPTGMGPIKISNLTLRGGNRHIDLGAFQSLGVMNCIFDNIYSFDAASDWALNFENCMHCKRTMIFQRNAIPGGGIRVASTLSSILLPGNSVEGDEMYVFTSNRLGRGIRYEASAASLNGNTLNQIVNTGRIQVNRFGPSSTVAINATFTNGSQLIDVPDQTQFDLCKYGMPLIMPASAPTPYIAGKAYAVSFRDPNTKQIRLSLNQLSTAGTTATSGGAFTLTMSGFPGFEMIADANSLITRSNLSHVDNECNFNVCSFWFQRVRSGEVDIAEIYGSQTAKNGVVCRDVSLRLNVKDMTNIGPIDRDDNSNLSVVYTAGGERILTQTSGASGTLLNARHNCRIIYTGTNTLTFTVPINMVWSFDCSFRVTSTGKITIAQGAGTTVTPATPTFMSTSGPNTEIRLRMNGAENTFWLDGQIGA